MRAVVDPNVLISGLLSPRGAPARLLLLWSEGALEIVVDELLLAELERALGYRKLRARIPAEDAAAFAELLRVEAEWGVALDEPPVRSPDPGDDYLIALAAGSDAALVSGDADLLGLRERLPVLTAAEAVARLETADL